MRYAMTSNMALANLLFSLCEANPVGWLNAIVFFGCLATLAGMVSYDACEWAWGERS